MAQALYPLRQVNIGLEATIGTAVAATQALTGDGIFIEEIDREFEEFPRGVRAPVTGGGFDIRHGSRLEWRGNCSWEELIYPFLLGIANDAVPTGADPYTWTFDPVLTTVAVHKTATIEFTTHDGSGSEVVEREAAYMFCTDFEIGINFNQITTLAMNLVGRRSGTSTVTGALTPVPDRTPIPANLWTLAIDTTWSGLGGTPKTLLVRSATLRVNTGLTPDYTLDGRTDLDMTGVNSGQLTASLQLVCEAPAALGTEYAIFRGNGIQGSVGFYRLQCDNGLATVLNKKVTIDMAMKHVSPPRVSQEGGVELYTLDLALEYDATGAKALVANIINGQATQP